MVKLRLKRYGRKQQPTYRIIAIEANSRREGRALKEVGYYDPIRKKIHLDTKSISLLLKQGAQPSDTVDILLKKLASLDV